MTQHTQISGKTFRSFRVASLNVLHNEDSFIELRLPVMIKELESLQPDILMLQECKLSLREAIVEALQGIGYIDHHFASAVPNNKPEPTYSGTAIFSKFMLTRKSEIGYSYMGAGLPHTTTAHVEIEEKTFVLFSNHLAWGPNEWNRLKQVKILTAYAGDLVEENPEIAVVLGGDLNATDRHDSIRYLTGHLSSDDNFKRNLWIDAWELAGTPENNITTTGSDFWGTRTAHGAGITVPELIAPRRIDYVFVYGWAYGRLGCPLTFGRWADTPTGDEREISDHYGVYSDLMLSVVE